MEQPKPKAVKRHYCAYCGDDMGLWDARYCASSDTCGRPDCERFARDEAAQERAEAHEQLDRDRGW